MPSSIQIAVSLLAVVSVALYRRIKSSESPQRGYVLFNSVTHARLLPAESSHTFTYPTISVFVSLNALEAHELDLGPAGLVFSYGRRLGTLVGLRSKPHLGEGDAGIREKLDVLLLERGFLRPEDRLIEDVWMMTMPSFLGFEGINPLTVYFVYAHDSGALWLTVLEIHNTFGEAHVHVLERGVNEDKDDIAAGYTNQWTFPRSFHVSPFNSRAGFYTVSVKAHSQSPTSSSPAPHPIIRVHLHNPHPFDPTKPGDLKLTALLRATSSEVLSISSLLRTLARAPFALILSMARILYQARKLHYTKQLSVYIRPEPLPDHGGSRWLKEGPLERQARLLLEDFLRKRSGELGIAVTLIPADIYDNSRTFAPTGKANVPSLEISYASPRFFTLMLTAPSAEHALLLGYRTERLFTPSSSELFLRVFASPSLSNATSFGQRIRGISLAGSLSLPVPMDHFLDACRSATVLAALQIALDAVERHIFSLFSVRIVPGDEPWLQWERAAIVHNGGTVERQRDALGLGSLRAT
ncbi:hypothetical protein HDZ31DRAFT_36670 [Schizophyllum fasciatum]